MAGAAREHEPHVHAVGHCERCETIVEPMLSTQWFVKMEPLAKPAIEAVEQGKTKFVPDTWSKTFFHWMHNIRDWCISRQLWWGHRIPAWTCGKCNEITVARTTPAACSKCGAAQLTQDEDVLDTWFSSWLWPFATLGWPNETRELKSLSIIASGYGVPARALGAVSVIGPVRMDYGKAIASVRQTADELSRFVGELYE